MSLIDRCYHWEMCYFFCFTFSTKITLNVTPFHYWGLEQHCTEHSNTEIHTTPHHTPEWQTQADMMTLCCKHVRDKISCVKFLRLYFRLKDVGLIFELIYLSLTCLHTKTCGNKNALIYQQVSNYKVLLCSQTSEFFLLFFDGRLEMWEGGSDGVMGMGWNICPLYNMVFTIEH